MHLIVDIDIGGPTFQGTTGPAEAAQKLRELANEIECKVVDSPSVERANAWPARTADAKSPISPICSTSKLAWW